MGESVHSALRGRVEADCHQHSLIPAPLWYINFNCCPAQRLDVPVTPPEAHGLKDHETLQTSFVHSASTLGGPIISGGDR
jgi:hypothetical protein